MKGKVIPELSTRLIFVGTFFAKYGILELFEIVYFACPQGLAG